MAPSFISPTLPPARAQRHGACFQTTACQKPPRRARLLAQQIQQALQSALQSRQSRIWLQLPSGTQLGLVKRSQSERAAIAQQATERELARLLTVLFERKLSLHAVFASAKLAKQAAREWGALRDVSVGEWRGERRFSRGAAHDKDVLVFVGADARVRRAAQQVARSLGMDRLVIVVRAGETRSEEHGLDDGDNAFEHVYHMESREQWGDALLFRKFPHDWSVCRTTRFGAFASVLSAPQRPDEQQIRDALSSASDANVVQDVLSLFG